MVQRKRKQQKQPTCQAQHKKQRRTRPTHKQTAAIAPSPQSTSPLKVHRSTNSPNQYDSLFADPEDDKYNWKKIKSKLPDTSSLELLDSSTRRQFAEAQRAAVNCDASLASPLARACRPCEEAKLPNKAVKCAKKVQHKQSEPQPTSADKIPDFSSIERYSLVTESVSKASSRSTEPAVSQTPASSLNSAEKRPIDSCNLSVSSVSNIRPTLHFSTPMQQLQQMQRNRLTISQQRQSQQSGAAVSQHEYSRVSNIEHQSPLLAPSPPPVVARRPVPAAVAFRDKDSVREVSRRQPMRHCDSFYIRARKRASSRRRFEVVQVSSSESDSDDDNSCCEADKIHEEEADEADQQAIAASLMSSATAEAGGSMSPVSAAASVAASPSAEASLNATYWNLYTDGRHRDCVLRMCNQTGPLLWRQFLSERASASAQEDNDVRKLGEGVFGEVYSVVGSDGEGRQAVKVLPVAGRRRINGEPQKSFDQVLPELLIARKLTALCSRYRRNRSPGFAQLMSASVHRGRLHPRLATAWRRFAADCASENDCPADLPASQLWLAMRLAFAGEPLETYSLDGPRQAMALAGQVAASLAAAEAQLQFEHRDLHWGNVLVQAAPSASLAFLVAGRPVVMATRGAAATVIDFTISRLSPSPTCVMYTDLSDDDELFAGQGDYQFEIYRLMRAECRDNWRQFMPRTNIMWLHYLTMKLLEKLQSLGESFEVADDGIVELKRLADGVLRFPSCRELVLTSGEADLFGSVKLAQA